MQYHENVTLSTRDSEECTGHVKSYRFLQQRRTRDRRNLRQLPDFRFAQISPLLWSFPRFSPSFIAIEVSNEEEYSILRILYCYSLQQLIFLAFCNDFDTLSRAPIYSSQKHNIVIPEMTSEANSSHSPLFLGREHGNVQNYKL